MVSGESTPFARVVEWQTRQLEGLVTARSCRFNSCPEHHPFKRPARLGQLLAPIVFVGPIIEMVGVALG